ncbi:hypothetical protein NDU88_002312 [Pleurodeles waltl]|uniref:Uncharacterized protein n=1 Tax=Pleurodeles waltl TaxID=8319 RepID=A0AAV7UWN2_PLEWA|nr:hypothetical protein NDU88_002312 [Pleurodeles waltl]
MKAVTPKRVPVAGDAVPNILVTLGCLRSLSQGATKYLRTRTLVATRPTRGTKWRPRLGRLTRIEIGPGTPLGAVALDRRGGWGPRLSRARALGAGPCNVGGLCGPGPGGKLRMGGAAIAHLPGGPRRPSDLRREPAGLG